MGMKEFVWPARREMKVWLGYRRGRECPICGNTTRFLIVNDEGAREETLCLRCMSLERHRRTVLLLRRFTNLYSEPLKVLHVAPERSLRGDSGARMRLAAWAEAQREGSELERAALAVWRLPGSET